MIHDHAHAYLIAQTRGLGSGYQICGAGTLFMYRDILYLQFPLGSQPYHSRWCVFW